MTVPQQRTSAPKKRKAKRRERKGVLFVPEEQVRRHRERFPGLFDPSVPRVLFALRALAQRIDDDYNIWLAQFGLTAAKVNHLAVLYGTEGQALSVSDLSRYIHASNSNVSVIVDAMARDGLVQKKPDASDRRRVLVVLRAKGRNLFEKAFPIHVGYLNRALDGVTNEERDGLVQLLLRIGSGFDGVVNAFIAETEAAATRR